MRKIKFLNYLQHLLSILILLESINIDVAAVVQINNNSYNNNSNSNLKQLTYQQNGDLISNNNQISKNIGPEISLEEDEIINDNNLTNINRNNIISELDSTNNNETTINTTIKETLYSNRKGLYHFNSFQCFSKEEREQHINLVYNPGYKQPINIRVSNRATHHLLSRIFGIFLHEILGYQNVSLVPQKIVNDESDDVSKLVKQFIEISLYENLIDLEVWMFPNFHAMPYNVFEAGTVTSPGRYGWYTEMSFMDATNKFAEDLHYGIFLDPDISYYRRYVVDKIILNELESKFGFQKVEKSKQCQNYNNTCATIFAPGYDDTSFLSRHIDEFDFYLQIIWIGDENFKKALNYLHTRYKSLNLRTHNKRYLFLSWSPSDIIDDNIEYIPLTLPPCERFRSAAETTCKYEMTPILKYYERKFQNFKLAFDALTLFEIERKDLRTVLLETNSAKINNPELTASEIYNRIACNYLKTHPHEFLSWTKTEKSSLMIGGIFPLTGNGKSYGNLIPFVRNAVEAINNNSSVLSNFRLFVSFNDGQCKADTVMKAFIHYFNLATPLIGVLGPACSETVEPIAGVSKHTRMTVISYSAEGALFTDREEYPYFFRTIGSNRQYERVYIDLFKKLEWKQMGALTEDGQKYTEYISHMDTILKQEGIDLILNKKFPKDVAQFEMNRVLQEFKNKNAKIIIADINNDNAKLIMCEAYHLQMYAKYGYIWFLPSWISKSWSRNDSSTIDSKNLTCTQEELFEAVNGHFSLNHAPFAPNDSIMIENCTVQEWKESYFRNNGEENISNYAGFVYDAVWVYALAADKLLRENPSAIYDLRSPDVIKRFSEIIGKTDFNGLSGRIRFDEGGSRIDNINILQWVGEKFNVVGRYVPEIEEEDLKVIGGELSLNESGITWLTITGERPKDGAYECSMSALAELLQTNCENVNYIVIILSLVVALCVLSTGSFIFWKYRYHAKLKQSAKVMKNFGIDLLSPNAKTYNTLDKWEVSKDKIVINRRLGDGAFGTVYGGEAQLADQGWTAVAVKTLKSGASTEDRLDFLCEAEAMKRFDHKNIIKLLGVCLQNEPIYTIMEYMLYGDLKTFLLARRHLVSEKLTEDSDISPKRLSMYALDVARGLSYLADEKYVHRDVACRNCLVNARRVVKLGDFGMARPIFESDYYRFNRKGMLPVRWMAPESLGLGLFTPASDVWSFAVLLYEIITFGSFPYQGLTNNQALEEIKQGKIITIPHGVKPHLEGLMKACWSSDYKKRPTASEIVEYISTNPRLLSPCLDVPLSSVQIGETDSDQLELLPGLRKRVLTQPKIDILSKTSNLNNYDEKCNSNINLNDFKNDTVGNSRAGSATGVPSCTIIIHNDHDSVIENVIGNSIEENNLNGYSVMSPLLKMEPEITNSNLSLRRYVPMYNIGKKPKNHNNNNNNNSSNGGSPNNKLAIDSNNKIFKNDMELVEIRS